MPAPHDPYAAEVQHLRRLIEEFATFCSDSGWSNVAEELRRRALVARDAAPPPPCPGCARATADRARIRVCLGVLRADALALATRVAILGAGDLAAAAAADGLERLVIGMEALAEGIGTP